MNTRLRFLSPINLFLLFGAWLAVGLIFLAAPVFVDRFLYAIFMAALGVNTALVAGYALCKQSARNTRTLLSGALSLLALVLFAIFPDAAGVGLSLLIGIWTLVNGAIAVGFAIQLIVSKSTGLFRAIARALLVLFTAALFLFFPFRDFFTAMDLAGLYCIFHSVSYLYDALDELIDWDESGKHIKRRVRLRLPVLMTAMLPTQLLEKLNRRLLFEAKKPLPKHSKRPMKSFEVLFHLGRNVAHGLGHVDVSIGGKIYAYGCYDQQSQRLMGLISEGVFACAQREPYLEYAMQVDRKSIIGYTIRVPQAQYEKMRASIEQIIVSATPWTPPDPPPGQPPSAPTLLNRSGVAQYFKPKAGPYRIYNVFKTNCVAMAELIVGEADLPIMQQNGIITPGTYYAYLDQQFMRQGGFVVARKIYTLGKGGSSPNERLK